MCNKVAYPSPNAAHGALIDIQRRRRRENGKSRRKGTRRGNGRVEKKVYKCPEPGCRMWHLTSQGS